MASTEEVSFFSEWECDEEEGEDAGRRLTRNNIKLGILATS